MATPELIHVQETNCSGKIEIVFDDVDCTEKEISGNELELTPERITIQHFSNGRTRVICDKLLKANLCDKNKETNLIDVSSNQKVAQKMIREIRPCLCKCCLGPIESGTNNQE
ncbi:MAG: hypothetical protein PHU71_04190 [Candidatus Gracilibacteria bacterium]|nr:hypothetical protein [Candidatus Gracilibacteria bacterium]